jgi:curved DNA-binding protein CbpA
MTETFYDVLGVAEDATTDEIESAYRERLKQAHPDVSDSDDAERATKSLIEARDVLVDETERARYDRLGHAAYVGNSNPSASDTAASTDETDAGADEQTNRRETESRASRERRASERVRQERSRGRQQRRGTGPDNGVEGNDAASTTTDRETGSTGGHRESAAETTSATGTGNPYSVRNDVTTTKSRGPLLPRGRQLTLLGIFFPLYPLLVASALFPAFPTFVNLVLSACTLLTIVYLQSVPRVALLCFGGWTGIGIVGLGLTGVGYISAVGFVVLAGTILPFGFSILTVAALRY